MVAYTCIVAMCTAILAQDAGGIRGKTRRLASCVELGQHTVENTSFDVFVVAALAYTESRFNKSAVSSAGARGILQVLPKYWCRGSKSTKCNYLSAGFRAWGYYRERSPTLREALCKYASGRSCGKRSTRATRYADRVLGRARLGENSCRDGC